MTLRVGSLFAGYGGLDLGLSMVCDAEPVWMVEFDRHPSTVLAQRYPGVPNYGDVTAVDWTTVPPVDVLTGGFPCQDVSHAGLRKGIKPGTRSGLWEHFAYAISILKPRLVVIENVAGLLSADAHCDVEPCPWCVGDEPGGHMRALGAVLSDLAEIGFDAEWASVRASDAGAPHRRERIFIVASNADGIAIGAQPCDVTSSRRRRRDGEHLRSGDGAAADAARERHDGAGDAGPGWWPGPTDGGAGADGLTLLPTPSASDGTSDESLSRDDFEGRGYETKLLSWVRTAHDAYTPYIGHRTHRVDLLPGPDIGICCDECFDEHRDTITDGDPYFSWHWCPSCDNQDAGTRYDYIIEAVPPRSGAADFGPYSAAIHRWEQVLGRSAPPPTEPGKDGRPRLSPRFVEWMMGLPDGWVTDCGIPRNAQLKCLGNGVVPAQAALALSMLLPRLYGGQAAGVGAVADVPLLPTPNAALGTGGQTSRSGDRKGEPLLGNIAALLPTPTVSDTRDGAVPRQMSIDAMGRGSSKGVNLNHLFEHDDLHDFHMGRDA